MRMRTHKKQYTTVSNSTAQSDSLSWGALGLLTYCLSMPEDWNFRPKTIWKNGKGGRDQIYRLFAELIEHGHCIRIRQTHIHEKMKNLPGEIQYEVFDDVEDCKDRAIELSEKEKFLDCREEFKKFFRCPGFPDPGFPDPGFQDTTKETVKNEKEEKTNKQFVCSFDQEKLDLLKGFSLSKKIIEEFCRFTIEELKSSLEAYKQYVDDELSKGNSIDNNIAILRKAIEAGWKPKSTGMKESDKKQNIKKNLEFVREWEYEGLCKFACNNIVFSDRTFVPIDSDPNEVEKKIKQTLKNAKRCNEERKHHKPTE